MALNSSDLLKKMAGAVEANEVDPKTTYEP